MPCPSTELTPPLETTKIERWALEEWRRVGWAPTLQQKLFRRLTTSLSLRWQTLGTLLKTSHPKHPGTNRGRTPTLRAWTVWGHRVEGGGALAVTNREVGEEVAESARCRLPLPGGR